MSNPLQATEECRTRWSKRLYAMWGPGRRRKLNRNPSKSLLPLLDRLDDNSIILDVGCGESYDYQIARELGLISYRLDFFAPSTAEHFLRADALHLPFSNESIDGILCHAMLALLAPYDRFAFYKECVRVLKPKGLLSITPYDLADGFPVVTRFENDRAVAVGLHKTGSGMLYKKCAAANCKNHLPQDDYEAIKWEVNQIDTNQDFRRLAPILLAWFACTNWTFAEVLKFTDAPEWEVRAVYDGAIACGIFNPTTMSFEAPWFNHFLKDENAEANISLILDVLAIEGRVERSYDADGELCFKAIKEES